MQLRIFEACIIETISELLRVTSVDYRALDGIYIFTIIYFPVLTREDRVSTTWPTPENDSQREIRKSAGVHSQSFGEQQKRVMLACREGSSLADTDR